MSEFICQICNKDFKYKSIYTRHVNAKRKCKPIVIPNDNIIQQDATNYNINDKLIDFLKLIFLNNTSINKNINEEFDKKINAILEERINSSNNVINNIPKENIIEDNKINELKSNKNKPHICNFCNKGYTNRPNLSRHKKTCYQNNTEVINHNTTTSTNSNNIINNTTNNNIINITNNYNIARNPFGYESLEHITFNDFKSIFSSLNGILQNVCNYVYLKNETNMNFCKQNQNKFVITYLDKNFDIVNITETKFIEELKHNINNLAIELFHIFKSQLNVDELISYMRNLIVCQENNYFNKSENSTIKHDFIAIIDKLFRDTSIRDDLIKIEYEIKNNDDKKKILKSKYENRVKEKYKRLNEYYKKPKALQNTEIDNKNLYKIKEKAIELKDKKTDEVFISNIEEQLFIEE